MPMGVAQAVLFKHGISRFGKDALRALNNYLERFPNADEFEKSIRENIVVAAAAELASVWDWPLLLLRRWPPGLTFRALLDRGPMNVVEDHIELGVEVADTASTVECYTVQAARENKFRVSDLFLLTGDAAKAQRAIRETDDWRSWNALGLAKALDEQFSSLAQNWHSPFRIWRQKYATYFASLRFCLLKNLDEKNARDQMDEVRTLLIREDGFQG